MKLSRLASMMILCAACLMTGAAQDRQQEFSADHSHDYASLFELDLNIENFTFPLLEGGQINLREAAGGHKLILIHYFAAWCHNSNYDVVTINELYRKYRDSGLEVIAVCEYSNRDSIRKFVDKHKPEYKIAVEGSGRRNERATSTHYKYRMKAADSRLWGTPLNILIEQQDIKAEGEIVAVRARVANGELIKTEVEELISRKLSR
ncbi:MAG: TlpA family protein disulfide reductase [Acidobacteriota bacterium]|nr:MAG: TlpA family protein disulfide reductase [Acidobacteriota bacterium]